MRDDDDIWFDSLAGGEGDEPEKAALAARAIRTEPDANAAEEPPVVDDSGRRENELIARARAEGVLQPSRTSRYRRLPAFLAAAAIAGLAVTVALQMRTESPPPVTRGSASAIARIHSEHPKELQQHLIRELKAAGVQARGYESFGRPGIDADLPVPLTSAVREILERNGITPPRDNVLQLEIDAATP